MMKNILSTAFFLFSLFISTTAFGQELRIIDSVNFNIHLQAYTAYFDDHFELQENVPRTGIWLNRAVGNEIEIFGRLEFGVNLAKGNSFNNNNNSASDFFDDPFDVPTAFTSRLGYLGIYHPVYGSISMGKQWGTYYDIGGYTDAFTVFGGNAVDVYSGNTDGGWKGTGRADRDLVYRNKFGNLRIGLQTQLFSTHSNYGASATYGITQELEVGAAFNRATFPDEYQAIIPGLNYHSDNYLFGAKYSGDRLYTALTYAHIEDHFYRIDEDATVTFPVWGMEYILQYRFTDRFRAETGFNIQKETDHNEALDEKYKLLQYYMGINYFFGEQFSVYLSARIDDSRLVPEEDQANVILIGFSYDLVYGKKFGQ
ncbi:porin [Robertkochia solimangrovi]|uniref:porin n=1 Tax=Robertkochia solimangrovi TaxID=2213046 RepID=UPI00117DF0E8|nr:porin [Robertkochia solimangrovi]TRZ41169.1 hypothetical protein DMZ48_18015 [Robertkochia solimangrovi]